MHNNKIASAAAPGQMSYRLLDHATDAIVEVTACSMDEAFTVAGRSVVDITLDAASVTGAQSRTITIKADNLRHLLLEWLEAVIYQMITEGFAISGVDAHVRRNGGCELEATITGEPIDLSRHGFKVEIKAPTFHEMEIVESGNVKMKFLLDL